MQRKGLFIFSTMSQHDVRPGDWTCLQCGANVFASKSSCFKCGAPKPGAGGNLSLYHFKGPTNILPSLTWSSPLSSSSTLRQALPMLPLSTPRVTVNPVPPPCPVVVCVLKKRT